MNLSSPVRLDEICSLSPVAYDPVRCGNKPNRLKPMRAIQVRAVNHGGRNFQVSGDGNNKGTAANAVASPAGSRVAVDASRLEPRVEEKDGYWVLKEEFRAGINPQEKIKLEREPMKLFMENGIEELSKKPLAEIDSEKVNKDDVDVRLKWLGLFHRRKHQYGRFMMRLKLPNGVTTSLQTRYLASVIEKYGEEGCADITTRQNWQIRGVVLDDVPAILKGLKEVGLSSLQSGMDNVRNPVGNPLAGIDPDEIIDTRPYTKLLTDYIVNSGKGNPSITNLPRKWNVCVVGTHDLFEHPHINDLAYVPAMKSGRFGFNLLVGGFFSPKRCEEALPLDAWVAGEDVVPVCKAILEAYRDLGTRGNRQKTRMMWLIDELGIEGFRAEVVKRMPGEKLERAPTEDMLDKSWERRSYLGVHPRKQAGLNFVGLHVPVGLLQADDMLELARLAEQYGTRELRLFDIPAYDALCTASGPLDAFSSFNCTLFSALHSSEQKHRLLIWPAAGVFPPSSPLLSSPPSCHDLLQQYARGFGSSSPSHPACIHYPVPLSAILISVFPTDYFTATIGADGRPRPRKNEGFIQWVFFGR